MTERTRTPPQQSAYTRQERIPASEARKALIDAQKGTQRVQGTKRVKRHGISFHSTKEADRYDFLLMRLKAGEISQLQLQVPIPLMGQLDAIRTPTGLEMTYRADFQYIDHQLGDAVVIEDAKGYPTEVYKIKKAILAAMGIEVEEV